MKNEIFDAFTKYEYDKKLFDVEFNGIHIWEIMRTFINLEIVQYKKKLRPIFNETKDKNNNTFKKIISYMKGIKIFFLRKADILVINNPRRVLNQDGKYYCINSDCLIDVIKKKI